MTKYHKYAFSHTSSATSKRQDEKVVIPTAGFMQLKNESICKFR